MYFEEEDYTYAQDDLATEAIDNSNDLILQGELPLWKNKAFKAEFDQCVRKFRAKTHPYPSATVGAAALYRNRLLDPLKIQFGRLTKNPDAQKLADVTVNVPEWRIETDSQITDAVLAHLDATRIPILLGALHYPSGTMRAKVLLTPRGDSFVFQGLSLDELWTLDDLVWVTQSGEVVYGSFFVPDVETTIQLLLYWARTSLRARKEGYSYDL